MSLLRDVSVLLPVMVTLVVNLPVLQRVLHCHWDAVYAGQPRTALLRHLPELFWKTTIRQSSDQLHIW